MTKRNEIVFEIGIEKSMGKGGEKKQKTTTTTPRSDPIKQVFIALYKATKSILHTTESSSSVKLFFILFCAIPRYPSFIARGEWVKILKISMIIFTISLTLHYLLLIPLLPSPGDEFFLLV
jgi:hypothetical protein